jgi:hypothetical protein
LVASRKERRFSRIVAYFLVLGSFLALCNVAVQPVSSQAFDTLVSTQTNTATYFTVSVATANLSATVLTMQYTTSTSLFTLVNVQFTTLTSYITGIQIIQPPEGAPPFRSSHPGSSVRSPAKVESRDPPIDSYAFFGRIEAGLMLQIATCVLVFLASTLFILRKRSDR